MTWALGNPCDIPAAPHRDTGFNVRTRSFIMLLDAFALHGRLYRRIQVKQIAYFPFLLPSFAPLSFLCVCVASGGLDIFIKLFTLVCVCDVCMCV